MAVNSISSAFGDPKIFLKNLVDVVTKLRNRYIDNNTILCSFDVVSMYTNCVVKKNVNSY